MSDGYQFRNVEDVIAYLKECESNRTAVGLGYDLRNMLLKLAEEVRDLSLATLAKRDPLD